MSLYEWIMGGAFGLVALLFGLGEYVSSRESLELAKAFPRSKVSIENCVKFEGRTAFGDLNNDGREDVVYVKTHPASVDVYVREGLGNVTLSELIKAGEIPTHLRMANILSGKIEGVGFNSLQFCEEKGKSNLVVSVDAGFNTEALYQIASLGNGQYASRLVTLR